MIALFSDLPSFCPHCGDAILMRTGQSFRDALARCSHTCECGLQWQLADKHEMLRASEVSGGDMEKYTQEATNDAN